MSQNVIAGNTYCKSAKDTNEVMKLMQFIVLLILLK